MYGDKDESKVGLIQGNMPCERDLSYREIGNARYKYAHLPARLKPVYTLQLHHADATF